MVTFKEVPPAITEQRYTRLIAEFANSGQLTGVLLRIPGVQLLAQIDRSGQVIPGTAVSNVPIEHWKELREIHEQLRKDLSALLHAGIDPKGLRRLTEAARMQATPQFRIDSNGELLRTWHYMPEGPAAAIAYGVLLIADAAGPYQRDLKQCRLDSCGRFFFSSDSPAATGRDRSRYCTPEHMGKAHKQTSAARTRRWRERKVKKAKRKVKSS
jgi:hypothetical protein